MDLFDFNVPFWVTIGRTKTFHREGEKLVGQKGSNNGKTCLLGEACSAFSLPRPPTTIKMNSNCFLPYKTHSLPENEHYNVCDVLNFVSPINMCLTNICYHIYTGFSSVHNTLSIIKPV